MELFRDIIQVSHMVSNNGNPVFNQFIIHTDTAVYFQSYKAIIIKKENGKVYLDRTYYDYSRTTIKYRNMFLRETAKEIEKKIKNNVYVLTNLN
jgi:hypothetical protein